MSYFSKGIGSSKLFRSGLWLFVLLIGLAVTPQAFAYGDCDDPLPADLVINQPGSDVPSKLAEWSGVWHGKWGGSLCSSLAIDFVDADGRIRFVYTWGKGPKHMPFDPGFTVGKGRIEDGSFGFGSRTTLKFVMTENGEIAGEHYTGRTTRITMKKIKFPN